jgi:hypothetical protein
MEEFEKLAADQGDLFTAEATSEPAPAETTIEQADGAGDTAEEAKEAGDLQSDSTEVKTEAESTTNNT